MAESTESTERAGGFDRRSLIKKGLVVGGAAVALPVITTFDAPAFAASPPPTGTVIRAQFNILAQVGLNALGLHIAVGVLVNEVTPSSANPCGLAEWSTATDAPGSAVSGSGTLLALGAGRVTFNSPTCVFAAGARTAGGGCLTNGVITNGGHRIHFDLGTVEVDLAESVYLVLHCA